MWVIAPICRRRGEPMGQSSLPKGNASEIPQALSTTIAEQLNGSCGHLEVLGYIKLLVQKVIN